MDVCTYSTSVTDAVVVFVGVCERVSGEWCVFVSRFVILSVLMMVSVFVLLCRCQFQSELAIGFYPVLIRLLMDRYGPPENFLRNPFLQVNFVPTAHT